MFGCLPSELKQRLTMAEFAELCIYDQTYGLERHAEPEVELPKENPMAQAERHFQAVANNTKPREHKPGGLNRRL